MLLQGVRFSGVLTCMLLYCAVFIIVRYGMAMEGAGETQFQPGLLLFVLPGVLAGLASREAPLSVAIGGALLATPVCLLALHSRFVAQSGFWQEFAWYASALFWCGLGALGVMLWRAICRHYPHL